MEKTRDVHLTPKQRKLVQAMKSAESITEAGIQAGYGSPDNINSVRASTSRALRSVNVKVALEEQGITERYIIENFKRYAGADILPEQIKASDALRANENLAKMKEMYPSEKIETYNHSLSIELKSLSIEQLENRLVELDAEIQKLREN